MTAKQTSLEQHSPPLPLIQPVLEYLYSIERKFNEPIEVHGKFLLIIDDFSNQRYVKRHLCAIELRHMAHPLEWMLSVWWNGFLLSPRMSPRLYMASHLSFLPITKYHVTRMASFTSSHRRRSSITAKFVTRRLYGTCMDVSSDMVISQ